MDDDKMTGDEEQQDPLISKYEREWKPFSVCSYCGHRHEHLSECEYYDEITISSLVDEHYKNVSD